MRRLALGLILTLTSMAAFAHGFNVTRNGNDCSASNFHWDGENAYVEKQVIEAGSPRTLKASVSHAPISVTGGNARGYTIEVCKAAARQSDLAAIRVSVDSGELRATGPDDRRWLVLYHIKAPNGGDLDVSATNGPLSIRDFDGTLLARTSNGPLSLNNVSGNVDATTTNGPISVQGGSGEMKVRASNGPLSIDLEGNSWTGGTLDASTKNGPLSLTLPRGYNSGVVVETNGRGPVACRAEGCERFRAERDAHDWNEQPRRIELGHGPESVRLSTVNGPVTIKDE
jgi:hypothetical protein